MKINVLNILNMTTKHDLFWKSTPHEVGLNWANDVGIMGFAAYPLGYVGRFICTVNCLFLLLVLGIFQAFTY